MKLGQFISLLVALLACVGVGVMIGYLIGVGQ